MSEISKQRKDKKDKPLEIVEAVKTDLEKYFKNFKKLFKEEEEAYYGVIWKNTNQYRPYENNIFDIIETEVPILTDSFPAPSVTVKDPDLLEQVKNLEKSIEWVNKDQNFILKYPEVTRKSLITGTGWLHVYYDQNANNGEGRNIYEILNWQDVMLSGRTDNIDDCDKGRIRLKRSREWLKLTYPEKSDELCEVKNESKDSSSENDRGLERIDSGSGYAKRSVPPCYEDEDTLTLVKTYKRDYTIEPIPENETAQELEEEMNALASSEPLDVNKWQNHKAHNEAHLQQLEELYASMGLTPEVGFDAIYQEIEGLIEENPEAEEKFSEVLRQIKLLENHIEEHTILHELNPKGGRLKYSGGYRVIETVNKIVCYDGPCKEWHNEIPLVPFYCYRNGSIYGFSEIRNIIDSQRMQAVMGYKEYKGLQKVSNPEKEVNLASGLTKDDVTNEDGAIYEVKEGTMWSVRNLPTGQVSNQNVRFQETRIDKMRQISGMTDPTRGELPDERHSEVTVANTQKQALGRIRLKDRQNQYYSLKRLAKLVASDIIQYWTTEKVVAVEEIEGEAVQVIYNPLEMQDLEYDVEIAAGAMAGIDKDQYNIFASSLLNNGHISFEQFTEIADMPKVEKLREFASLNSQIQQQQQQLEQALRDKNIETLKLRAQIDPALLSSEEVKELEEILRMEQVEQLEQSAGVNPDQPEAQELNI